MAASAKKIVDLAIVGGGSGGLQLLWHLLQVNKYPGRIAVVDFSSNRPGGLGGTCLNVGCIPKKLFHHAGSLASVVRGPESLAFGLPPALHASATAVADESGLAPAGPAWNWTTMTTNVNNYIRSLNFDLWRRVAAQPNVEFLKGEAVFDLPLAAQPPYSFRVGSHEVESGAVVICTGSKPRLLPAFHGDPRVVTSDDLFWRKTPLGHRVAIIGGGYIALESASMLQAIGHQVTVFLEEPLRAMDRQCARLVQQNLAHAGVTFVAQSPRTVTPAQVAAFDHVLLAVGRIPNVPAGLQAEAAALQPGAEGLPYLQHPTRPHWYAFGDVVHGQPQLTPVAHYLARQIGDHLSFGRPVTPLPPHWLLSAVFVAPVEYAFAGLTEEEAREQHGAAAVKVYLSRYNALDTSMLSTADPEVPFDHDGSCLAKLVCVGPSELVVGIHYVGPHASEVIQAFSLALRLGVSKHQFDSLLAIHPTSAEEFLFLSKTPADDFIKRAGCGGGGSC